MILKDFETGGFPVSRTIPALCFTEEGTLLVAYDPTTLSKICTENKIKICVGVWHGKINTDCFILSPDHYSKGK